MAHFSYNGVTEKRSFNHWAADNGIEVVTAWDAGMYGNIIYKVRVEGKLLLAYAYQSQHGNFTFDVNTNDREAANENMGCTLLVGQRPVKPGDCIDEGNGKLIYIEKWVGNFWVAKDQNGNQVQHYRRLVHPEVA